MRREIKLKRVMRKNFCSFSFFHIKKLELKKLKTQYL